MSLFSGLFRKNDKNEIEVERPEHICPNCWGEQEYAGIIRKAVYDKQIDVNNHEKVRSFVTKYVEENITGVYLQRDVNEGVHCPKCRLRYQQIQFSSGV